MAEDIQIKINAAVESAQAATTIGQLRNSLVELQDIAENSDLGAEQFRNLQSQIVSTSADLAAARDKIGDIQDKISTLQGTPIERVRNSFGLLKQAIFDLDFDKARIGVEGLANAFTPLGPDGLPLKGLAAMKGALGNVTGAASQLGTTFINLGRTLLTNPIFLLATVITTIIVGIGLLLNKLGLLQPIFDAIGAAVEYVTDAFNSLTEAIGLNTAATDKNLKESLAAEEQKRKALEQTLKTQESIAESVKDLNSVEQLQVEKLTGIYVRQSQDIVTTRLDALNKLKESYQKDLKNFDDVQKNKRKLTDDEKKQYDEIVIKVEETNLKIIDLTAKRVSSTNDALQKIRLRSIEFEEDDVKRARLLRDEQIKIAESEYDRRADLLQQRNALQSKLNVAYNKDVVKNLQQQIGQVNAEIKVITDNAAQDKFAAEKEYTQKITELNKKYADEQKERETNSLNEKKAKINDEILAEQNKYKILELDDKLSKERLLEAQKSLFEFEGKKRLEILDLEKATEAQKESLRIETLDKIKKAEVKAKEEQLSADEKLAQLRQRIADFDLESNKSNLLVYEAGLRARLKEIELIREKTTDETKLQDLREKEKGFRDELAKITEEQLVKEIENQRTTLEARLSAFQIIKDNNLKVNAETLSSAEKTQQLITDINTKGSSELAQVSALTLQDKQANIEAEKAAQLELLQFNFQQEAVKRAELAKTSVFINDLNQVDVELTKEYNAQRLAIIKAAAQEEVNLRKLTEDEKFNIARTALTQITELTNLLFDFSINRAKKNAQDEEKIAKQKFQVNKALQVGLAIMDGYKAITASLAQSPVAIGPVPNPAGIASLSFAISTSLLNIGRILATQYKSTGAAGAGGLGSVGGVNINGATPEVTGIPSQFTAPTFFSLGEERMATTVGANQQRVYVLESEITSTQNRVSVIESRSVIQ